MKQNPLNMMPNNVIEWCQFFTKLHEYILRAVSVIIETKIINISTI